VAAVKPWARQSGGQHGWNGIGTGSTVVRTGWLMSGAHAVLYFLKLSELPQTWKLKMDALLYSNNFQLLHVARLGYCEQFSQLCRHRVLTRIRVKNPGTDSTFESLMNFKRNLNLVQKSNKFSTIPS
jgi:hypothetical protein